MLFNASLGRKLDTWRNLKDIQYRIKTMIRLFYIYSSEFSTVYSKPIDLLMLLIKFPVQHNGCSARRVALILISVLMYL